MAKKRAFVSLAMTAAMMTILCGGLLTAIPVAEAGQTEYPVLKTASPISKILQAVTGLTPITGWIANRVLHRELGRIVRGDLHTKIRLFSGTDLMHGKAKSIAVSGHNVLLNDMVPLTEFHLQNQSDMPLYVSKGHNPILLRPVQFQVSAVMTEQDMNRMLTSEKGRRYLTGMKVSIPPFGLQALDVVQPNVSLDGGVLTVQSLINKNGAPLENALPVTVSGKITPDHASLALSDLHLQIEGMPDTSDIERLIENYFNDLVNLKHIKVAHHKVKVVITQSDIIDHRLNLAATVTVKPDDKALKKFLSDMELKNTNQEELHRNVTRMNF